MKRFLLGVVYHSPRRETIFEFTNDVVEGRQSFGLGTCPSLNFSVIVPFVVVVGALHRSFMRLSSDGSCLAVCFDLVVVPAVVVLLGCSKGCGNTFVCQITPLGRLGLIFDNAVGTFVFGLCLPICLLLDTLFLFLFKTGVLPSLITMFVDTYLCTIVYFVILGGTLPFSRSFSRCGRGNGDTVVFKLVLVMTLFTKLRFTDALLPCKVCLCLKISVVYLNVF